MKINLNDTINRHFGVSNAQEQEVIQSLWSGYGKIVRMGFVDGATQTVIAKHIQFPNSINHPRG